MTEGTFYFVAKKPEARPKLLANLLVAVSIGAFTVAAIVVGALVTFPVLRPSGIGTPELLALGLAIVAVAMAQAGVMCMKGCRLFRQEAMITAATLWLYPLLLVAVSSASDLTAAGALVVVGNDLWYLVGRALRGADSQIRDRASKLGHASGVSSFRRAGMGRQSRAVPELPRRPDHGRLHRLRSNARNLRRRRQLLGIAVLCARSSRLGPRPVRRQPRRRSHAAAYATRRTRCDPGDGRKHRRCSIGRSLAAPDSVRFCVPSVRHAIPAPAPWSVRLRLHGDLLKWVIAASSPGRSSLGALVSVPLMVALDFALIPPFGASGAAAAASVGLIAGGVAALAAYRSRHAFPWRAVVPGWDDALDIVVVARRVVTG